MFGGNEKLKMKRRSTGLVNLLRLLGKATLKIGDNQHAGAC